MWALGILLFQAFSSMTHPFEGDSQWDLINNISNYKKTKNLTKSVHPEISQLIDRLLDKDPEKRPSTKEVLEIPFIMNHFIKMVEFVFRQDSMAGMSLLETINFPFPKEETKKSENNFRNI